MRRRAVLGLTVLLALGGAAPALAQDPAGCIGNRLQADILKDRTFIRDGETINYTIPVSNNQTGACSVSSLGLRIQRPSATGAASPVLENVSAVPDWPFPAAEVTYGPFPYVGPFGPPSPAPHAARLSGTGRLHDVPEPSSTVNTNRDVQTLRISPALRVYK